MKRLLDHASAVIFDFDGVLADSEEHHFITYRDVFARYGHHIDEVEYYKYWTSLGHGPRGEIDRHGLDLDPKRIRDEKRPVFSQRCHDGSIRMFPEAIELVRLLAGSGKRLTVASGSVRSDIEAILNNNGVAAFFSEIIGSDRVPVLKPAPDILLAMLDAIHMEASQCVVIEDAEKGMHAAIAAAIPVIVVHTPQTEGFDFSPADLVVDSHAELIDLARRALTTSS